MSSGVIGSVPGVVGSAGGRGSASASTSASAEVRRAREAGDMSVDRKVVRYRGRVDERLVGRTPCKEDVGQGNEAQDKRVVVLQVDVHLGRL